jgi:hypothetical protein
MRRSLLGGYKNISNDSLNSLTNLFILEIGELEPKTVYRRGLVNKCQQKRY